MFEEYLIYRTACHVFADIFFVKDRIILDRVVAKKFIFENLLIFF